MSWQLVAEGPYESVQQEDIPSLPHGTKVKFELETAPGVAYLADIWGDEWVLNKFAVEGVTIERTYSSDSSHIICYGHVNSPGLATIVGLILLVLSIAGVAYIIHQIRVWIDRGFLPSPAELFTPENVAVIAAVGVAGTLAFLMFREVTR